jgi:hypothetical protein
VQSSIAVYWNIFRPATFTTFTSTWGRVAWFRLLEELELPWSGRPLAVPRQSRQPEPLEGALDRRQGHLPLVHTAQPDPRPRRSILEFLPD